MLGFSHTLSEVLGFPKGDRFAVVDGAQFRDFRSAAAEAGLACQPLHIEFRSPSVARTGPYLVSVATPNALATLDDLVSGKPAVVYWQCSNQATLYRHLRTIGLVWVPRGSVSPNAPNPDAEQTVLFRHCDPRALKMTLPQLRVEQVVRLLGPAPQLAYHDEEIGLFVHVRALASTEPVPPGPLKLSHEQMRGVMLARTGRSRRRIAACLLDLDPQIAVRSNASIDKAVVAGERSAAAFGIRTERGIGLWTYLLLVTHGRIRDIPEVQQAFRMNPGHGDETVMRLARTMAHLARTGAR